MLNEKITIGDLVQKTSNYREYLCLRKSSSSGEGPISERRSQSGFYWDFGKNTKQAVAYGATMLVIDIIVETSTRFVCMDCDGIVRMLFSHETALIQKGNEATQ